LSPPQPSGGNYDFLGTPQHGGGFSLRPPWLGGTDDSPQLSEATRDEFIQKLLIPMANKKARDAESLSQLGRGGFSLKPPAERNTTVHNAQRVQSAAEQHPAKQRFLNLVTAIANKKALGAESLSQLDSAGVSRQKLCFQKLKVAIANREATELRHGEVSR
jgi:hypothetical protein